MSNLKARIPTFGAYMVLYNAEISKYPWRESIRNALTFCERVYILECNSDDDTYKKICEEFSNEHNVVLKRSGTEWDMDDTLIVGKKKQEAREMVQEDYCVYLDCDEILLCRDKNELINLVLHHPQVEVFSLPYITFFGSPHKIANFPQAENYWRWKIFKNVSYLGHGAHGAARKYDENGILYIDKKQSDGCEMINLQTLEVVRSMLFMPHSYQQTGERYRTSSTDPLEKKKISSVFSEVINNFPLVCLHYGWVNFEHKARNGLNYWTKTKAYKSGIEHSNLFDGLTEESIQDKIEKWNEIDTIDIYVREHPVVIQPFLLPQIKLKILNIALNDFGPFGVPKWGHMLKDALINYDVQTFAFNNYVNNAPQGALEFQKSESFMKFIKQNGYDLNALVVFADGFWAAKYPGPAKVISIIHGLWSHPLRDKWDDGLLEQRQMLFKYQLAYYQQAKQMGHTLVCVSPFIHNILKSEYNIESILIPNAVDLNFWDSIKISSIDKDRPLILHGITSVNKGLDIIKDIENHPLIKDTFDIGTIDEIAKHGNVHPAVAFKAADVAFLPTKWEASSYLLLECLANNLPIAAYRAGILNCTDLSRIDDIGVIVDDYDVDTFANAIVEAYNNSIKYKMGRIFLQENNMTTDTWNPRMKKLIYEVL